MAEIKKNDGHCRYVLSPYAERYGLISIFDDINLFGYKLPSYFFNVVGLCT